MGDTTPQLPQSALIWLALAQELKTLLEGVDSSDPLARQIRDEISACTKSASRIIDLDSKFLKDLEND